MQRIPLMSKPASNAAHEHCRTVLCYLPKNSITPFVVWTWNTEFSLMEGCGHGDYCDNLLTAVRCFIQRGAQHTDDALNEMETEAKALFDYIQGAARVTNQNEMANTLRAGTLNSCSIIAALPSRREIG